MQISLLSWIPWGYKKRLFWKWGLFFLVLGPASTGLLAQKHNFKMGPIYFDLSAVFEAEFNDNINSADQGAESDIILKPGIDFRSEWKITNLNTLNFDLGVSYHKYLKNSNLDSGKNFLGITPNTNLSFNFFIDNWSFEVYDRIYYSIDATNALALDASGNVVQNVSSYGRFNNELGLDVDWDLNDLKIFFGVQRTDLIPTESEFSFTERTEHSMRLSPRLVLRPNLMVGASAIATENTYRDDVQNDSRSYTFMPFVSWQPTALLSVNFSVGWTEYSFDRGGTIGDSSDTSGFFTNLKVTHKLNRFYTHSISLGKSFNYGFLSNTTEVDRISYDFDVLVSKKVSLNGGLSYETSADSGGLSPEEYDRYQFHLGTSYVLSERLTSNLRYEFTSKDSDLFNRSFVRNRLVFGLRYDF